MVRLALVMALAGALALTGCARQTQVADEQSYGQGNLDPELAELSNLKYTRGRPLTDEERQVLAVNSEIVFHLTNEESDQVTAYVQYFLDSKRDTVKRWLNRAQPHLQYVRAVLASHKLPQDLMALPFIESGYNVLAYSGAGAGGMWQFMPATGRRFGLRVDYWVDERRNPYLATMAAAKYLAELHKRFGDWQLALAGYNAGEGKISRAMAASGSASFKDLAKDESWLREETRNYVPKFLAMVKILKNLKSLGFPPIDLDAAPSVKEVQVPGGTDLAALAQACGMSWDDFRVLNPGFRRQVSPPDEQSPVYLPAANLAVAQAYLRSPAKPGAGCKTMFAAKGDTWWRISSATGIPITALRRMNPGMPDTLGPGQSYLVPADSSPVDTMLANSAFDDKPVMAAKGAQPAQVQYGKVVPYSQTLKAQGVSNIASSMALNQPKPKPGNPAYAANASQHAQPAVKSSQSAPVTQVAYHPGSNAGAIQPASHQPQSAQSGNKNAASAMHAIAASAGDGRPSARPGTPQPYVQTLADKSAAKAQPAGKPQGQPSTQPNQGSSGKKSKYMVAKGETVWSIARKLNVNPHTLLAANNLTADSHLREGDSITIDGR